jgi:hypothetical protein
MTLDYLPDGSPDCPLIRLYDFTPAEAERLRAVLAELAAGTAERVDVHRLPFVESVGGCRLTLIAQTWDAGVVRRAGPAEFDCGFRPDSWGNAAGLVEPFATGAHGFQWLAGTPGEFGLLLSADGRW